MLTAYMRHLVLRHLINIAARVRHNSPTCENLAKWILNGADQLGLPGHLRNPQAGPGRCRDDDLSPAEWDYLHQALVTEYKASKRVRADRTALRLRSLGRYMGLSPTDVALLELLLSYETQPVVESMVDEVACHRRYGRGHRQFFSVANHALADVLGISMGTLRRRLAAKSPLVRSGLVAVESNGDFRMLERLTRLAHAPARSGWPGGDVLASVYVGNGCHG